jgi:predicted dehydrogenase
VSGRTGVGLVGTGFAATSHLDALARAGVRVAAIAGSDESKARAVADRWGVERAYGDFHALIEDASVDAVHNCTPNWLHAPVNSAVLAAGKHLLSEKPLGMSSAETARLGEEAAQAGVVSAVCFNYRHYPLVREAKALVASGDYGAPHFVHGSYLQDWLLHPTDWNWRLESGKAGASRALADIGSHWIDLLQYITGDVVAEVMGDLGTLHSTRRRSEGALTFERPGGSGEEVAIDTEDYASVLLRWSGGARGNFSVSQVSAGRKNRLWFEIDLRDAALAWDQEAPNLLWIGRRDEANRLLPRDPTLLSEPASSLAHFPGGHQEGWPDGLRNLVADFYGAIAARDAGDDYTASFATFSDAHRVVQTVEAIVASGRAQAWTRVGDPQTEGE